MNQPDGIVCSAIVQGSDLYFPDKHQCVGKDNACSRGSQYFPKISSVSHYKKVVFGKCLNN